MRYGLAATMLGRMALSGDFHALSDEQVGEVKRAQAFYAAASPVIRDGRSRLVRDMGLNWNEPRGWQAVVRHTATEALVVAHAFAGPRPDAIELPLPEGSWRVNTVFGDGDGEIAAGRLRVKMRADFSGAAFILQPR
jgi:hypothetical protein